MTNKILRVVACVPVACDLLLLGILVEEACTRIKKYWRVKKRITREPNQKSEVGDDQ